jgi:high-affinity nickel permease
MASILFLGFFIGMHHALEADHVAAAASISSDERSVRRIVKHGVVWGMGHTLTLLVFGGGAVMLGAPCRRPWRMAWKPPSASC